MTHCQISCFARDEVFPGGRAAAEIGRREAAVLQGCQEAGHSRRGKEEQVHVAGSLLGREVVNVLELFFNLRDFATSR